MKNKDTQQLGISVYILALRKQIEEEVKSRYSERIEYLVGANNELMNKLEECELECYGRGYEMNTATAG